MQGNIFNCIPDNLDAERFELIFQRQGLKIERIVSKGHADPEGQWQCQAHGEWVMIVQGEAVLEFEDEKVSLTAGSFVDIPAQKKHRVHSTHPTMETVWLAVHYD